ncbi:MAG TPA: M28 family peptidase [Gaiellaceae bacterium]|nr:M28 family peptidase [Gaiellaceae bacterium]
MLPRPTLPPTFDGQAAAALATTLESSSGRGDANRSPGSGEDADAAAWFRGQMTALGITTTVDEFSATVPGTGRVKLVNVAAIVPGRAPDTIVVMAHRDNSGTFTVHRDNASGTAALVELARGYTASGSTNGVKPQHTIVFLSTDGGVDGSLGARQFVLHSAAAKHAVAVVNLDTIATSGRAQIEISGPGPHSPSPTLLGSALSRLTDATGSSPGRPSLFGQLVDLAFPLSLYEQWPFLDRGISAITLTTAGDRPVSDPPLGKLDVERLGQMGRAAQELLISLDQGLDLSQGTSSYVYFAGRIVKGWALALVLIALVIPFATASIDLFARCRRRHVPLGPAFRAYRRRLGFWLWVGALFGLFALFGAFPEGAAVPPDPASSAAGSWPRAALTAFVLLAVASWLVARTRLVARRPATDEEELAGHAAALLMLGLIALLVMATNVYALILFVPSLHAWLWLPQVRNRPAIVRGLVFAAGLIGPALLLGLLAKRLDLGLDTPWYLAELTAIGYVPIVAVVLALAWVAVAAQLLAVTVGRYTPYPSAAEGAPPGAVRSGVRTVVLGVRARRRSTARQAVGNR